MNSVTNNTKILSENTSFVSAKSQINFIFACEHSQQKTFYEDGNHNLKSRAIKANLYWLNRVEKFDDINGLFGLFQKYEKIKAADKYAVMRGDWVSDSELLTLEEKRAAWQKAEADKGILIPFSDTQSLFVEIESNGKKFKRKVRRKQVLIDTPRDWVCIDFDGLKIEGLGPFDVTNPRPWVDRAILDELGPEFAMSSYILQLSSSAGIKDGISAHAWFMLAEPMDNADWKVWLEARTAELGRKPNIDKGLFDVERIHYIAPPEFPRPDLDPVAVKGASRWRFCEGLEDKVYLPGLEELRAKAAPIREKMVLKSADFNDNDEELAQKAFSRPGVVGAFNRCFSMSQLIDGWLKDKYAFSARDPRRVTWLQSEMAEGCRIVGNDTHMFSTYNSDPLEKRRGNAFDHIQAVLYKGDFGAAAEWAKSIPAVVEEMERAELAVFDEAPSPSWNSEIAPKASASDEADIFETKAPTPAASGEVLTPDQMMAEYPMPSRWYGAEALYRSIDGQWWYGYIEEDDDDDGESKKKKKKYIKLWSPLTFKWLMCASTEQITLSLTFRGPTGKPKTLEIPRAECDERNLEAQLSSFGWLRVKDGTKTLKGYLDQTAGRIEAEVRRRGWSKYKGEYIFAAPSGEIIGVAEGEPIRLTQGQTFRPDNARAGTLEGWRAAIEAVCAAPGHQNNALGLVAGLVGALPPGVMEHAMGGLVFHGETRSGKSLAARVGVSVWGRAFPVEKAQPGQTLFHTLSTTDTSIDNLAAFSNGTLLVLDELGAASEKLRQDISQLIYRIASGQGRIRTERDGLNIKDGASWSGFCVVTSEHALKDVTTRKLPQGTNARFINVPFASQSDTVLEWHAAASALRDGLLENYGHAGPEFVKAVLALGTQGLNNALADAGKHICPDGAGGIRDTALGILAALLACGRIAHSAGVIGELTMRAIGDAIKGLWETFENEQGQSEHVRCDEMIQEYFSRHLGAFELLTQRGNRVFVGGAKGLRSQLKNGLTRFYLTDDQLCEAVGRVWDAATAARFLKKAGRLYQNNAPNLKSNLRAGTGGKVRQFYMIDVEIIEESEFEKSPS